MVIRILALLAYISFSILAFVGALFFVQQVHPEGLSRALKSALAVGMLSMLFLAFINLDAFAKGWSQSPFFVLRREQPAAWRLGVSVMAIFVFFFLYVITCYVSTGS